MKNVFKKLFILTVTMFMTFTLVGVNKVSADEEITINGDSTITIYDGQVFLRKLDGTGSDFSSAGITVYEGSIDGFDKGTTAVDTWTSDGTDHPFSNLVEGSAYTLVETTVPENYVQAKNVKFTATRGKQNFTMTDYQVQAAKKDVDTYELDGYNDRAQGDAVLNDGRFQVLDSLGNVVENPYGESVYVLNNETFTFLQGLKEGETYYLHEVTPPTGYLPNEHDLEFTADLVAGAAETDYGKTAIGETTDGVKDLVFKNEVITGTVSIHKLFHIETAVSDYTDNEPGAEFTIILKSHVEKYREEGMTDLEAVQAAMEHVDELTDKEWDVIVTDDEGNAQSRPLAFGTYWMQQTNKEAPEAHMIFKHNEVVINENGSNKHFETVNEENRYIVQLSKVDAETLELITRNSAGFELYDENGEKVGLSAGTTFSEFLTNSEEGAPAAESRWLNPGDVMGQVRTPNVLRPGNYTLKETVVPWGYLATELPLTVSEDGLIFVNKDDTTTFLQDIVDQRVYGKLTINKEVEQWDDADVTHITHYDYSGIKFTIYAAEDIQNPVHEGLELSPAGNELKEGEIYGVYNLDEEGKLVVEHIPLGKYKVVETSAPDGIIMDATEFEVEFTQEDYETEVYEEEINPKNLVTKVALSKKDIAGEELPGAELSVLDSNGQVVDSWTSTDEPYRIEGLVAGATYTLVEDLAPVGYAKASSVEFTVKDDGSVTEVAMTDKAVYISKVSVEGDYVEGAILEVVNEGEIVDSWTTDGEAHMVENLEVGKTYILQEFVAPEGAVEALPIEFEVLDDGKDQYIAMVDTVESVKKVDQDGNLVYGAMLIAEDEEGNIVDSWISGQHIVDLSETDIDELDAGNSVIKGDLEIIPNMAPQNDMLGLLFGTQYAIDALVIDRSQPHARYYRINLDGDETEHYVRGLVAGQKYTVYEDYPIYGYYLAEDLELEPNGEEDHYYELVDNKINLAVLKVDDSGVELENAKMELFEYNELEDEFELIHSWTTVLEEEDISDLVCPGKIYKIVESETPAGHYTATEYTFLVPLHGSADKQVVYMVDIAGKISFLKYDPVTGLPVKDAKYAVFELADGVTESQIKGMNVTQMKNANLINVITSFVTVNDVEGQAIDINGKEIASMLHEGKTYYIQETEPPFGYDIDTEAHSFVMVGDKTTKQMLRVFDNPKLLYVRVAKADSKDVKYMLAGAEITIYKADGKIAKTKDGKDAIDTTDKNGVATFLLQFDQNQSYYALETKAPKDYYINRNKFDVKVSEDYTFFETDLIKVSVLDKGLIILPKVKEIINTGGGRLALGAVGVLAVAGCAYLIINKKKKDEEEEPKSDDGAQKVEDKPEEKDEEKSE